jgi:DNA-binding transcriptional regulator YiaG
VTHAPTQKQDSAMRFSAKGLVANRRRLGLSARAYGALVGASALSIYKWEQGAVQPRAKHLAALATLRGIGKKEAAARLEMLQGPA